MSAELPPSHPASRRDLLPVFSHWDLPLELLVPDALPAAAGDVLTLPFRELTDPC